MSGGVDSSVAAALLAQEGHEVIGVTLRLLTRGGEGFGCCGSPDDVFIAKRSAEKAGIPHYVLDYSKEFDEKVIDYFVNSYAAGETPNPCLACNRYIKFDRLKTFADSLGAAFLATGHYARVMEDEKGHHLFEAVDSTKDQSYVLYNFNQRGLASTFFPVGNLPKTKIREIARNIGLPNADKKDSQEICFVPNRDYKTFIHKKFEEKGLEPTTAKPGPIKDAAGQVLGDHRGVARYTVGQRSGLGLSVNERLYVTRLEASTNTVVVGTEEEGKSQEFSAVDLNWIAGAPPASSFNALVKIRYKHQPTPAHVEVTQEGIDVVFDQPQRAVTPGQAAVIYRWDPILGAREVLGGGKIIQPQNSSLQE